MIRVMVSHALLLSPFFFGASRLPVLITSFPPELIILYTYNCILSIVFYYFSQIVSIFLKKEPA